MNIYYFILLKTDITNEIFDKSMNCNFGPLRLRTDNTNAKVVLKFYENNIPYELLKAGHLAYSKDQILIEMRKTEWIRE